MPELIDAVTNQMRERTNEILRKMDEVSAKQRGLSADDQKGDQGAALSKEFQALLEEFRKVGERAQSQYGALVGHRFRLIR